MKIKSFFLCLFLVLTACYFSSLPAQAQPIDTVQLVAKPDQWYFDSANYLILKPHASKDGSFLKFGYQHQGFPAGTQVKLHYQEYRKTPWEVQYLLPGKNWRPLLWSQLQCKDEQCEEEESPPPPPPKDKPKEEEPEKFKCDWSEAMAVGGVGAIAGAFAPDIESSASTSNTEAKTTIPGYIYGIPLGFAIGTGGDCFKQYIEWKKEHPGYKANGKKK